MYFSYLTTLLIHKSIVLRIVCNHIGALRCLRFYSFRAIFNGLRRAVSTASTVSTYFHSLPHRLDTRTYLF